MTQDGEGRGAVPARFVVERVQVLISRSNLKTPEPLSKMAGYALLRNWGTSIDGRGEHSSPPLPPMSILERRHQSCLRQFRAPALGCKNITRTLTLRVLPCNLVYSAVYQTHRYKSRLSYYDELTAHINSTRLTTADSTRTNPVGPFRPVTRDKTETVPHLFLICRR